MLHGVMFAPDGKVYYRNRWVRTPTWELENSLGRGYFYSLSDFNWLYGIAAIAFEGIRAMFGGVSASPGNTLRANTNIVFHDRRLLALVENANAFWVSAKTLESRGVYDYNGAMKASESFTAHPKIDPVTGEMFAFGYQLAQSPCVHYFRVLADGTKQPSVPVPLTDGRAVMMHDFAFTKNHAVFLDFPYVFDATQVLSGKPPLAFRPDLKTRIGVLPRTATDTTGMRWFDIQTGWAFHVANSWEVNNVITVLACRSPKFSLDQLGESGKQRALVHAPRLYHYEIDLSKPDGANNVVEKYVSECASEFPVCDERNRWGYATRYIWSAGTSPTKGRGFTSIIKHDLRDDSEIVFRVSILMVSAC
jgi:carotenoid cleavage dioxygenase-like enzyme